MDSYKPEELKEMLAMALKNNRVYRVHHNAKRKNGDLFNEIIIPMGGVEPNGNFICENCPKFIITADKQTCVVTHMNILFYETVEQKVPQIYRMAVKRYLQLWVDKLGDKIDYISDYWIGMRIKSIYDEK